MRIIKEEILSKQAEPEAVVFDDKSVASSEIEPDQPRRRKKNHRNSSSCFNFLACLFLLLLIIFGFVAGLVIFIAGPIVKKIDSLPNDFPKQIVIYQLDNAIVKTQTATGKEQLLKLLNSLPDWVLAPWINYLTTDAKTQIIASEQNPQAADKIINLPQLTQAVTKNIDNKTVSLSWKNINKSKEDISDYYTNKLLAEGFTVKEKINDYEIDLSFIGNEISGAISITDNFANGSGSIVDFIVNYKAE